MHNIVNLKPEMISKEPGVLKQLPDSKKDTGEFNYLGQNGLYNLDLDMGGYFIPGLGPKRGLL